MDIKNDIKNGMKLASDVATDAVQALIDKSRMRANANRIRQVIKSDTELRDQAYIELGRYVYENMRDTLESDEEALCVVVDKTSKRIEKATNKYIEFVAMANDIKVGNENFDAIRKSVSDKLEVAKQKASELKEAARDTVEDITYKAKEKVENIKVSFDDDDIASILMEDEDNTEESVDVAAYEDEISREVDDNTAESADEAEQTEFVTPDISASDILTTDDEESPDDFDF